MSKLSKALQAAAGNNGGPPDPQFNYVTMLLHGDGTNGAQNNTFVDSSGNSLTCTRNGDPAQGSFSPYGSNWSNYFAGGDTRIQLANTANLDLGSGDFCFEFWFNGSKAYSTYSAAYAHIAGKGSGNGGGTYALAAYNSKLYFSGITLTGTTTLQVGVWYHAAITRSGTTVRLFLNGVQEATTTSSTNLTSTANFGIGDRQSGDPSAQYPFTGYVSNLRIVKGSAVYTSDFTPSTTPLTAISGTTLLACNESKYITNSSYTWTVTGTTSVQRFNPFGTPSAYSTTTIGGSGYFDGTDGYLGSINGGAALTFGTGDFTVEGWVYPTLASTNGIFQISVGTTGLNNSTSNSVALLQNSGTTWQIYAGNTNATGGTVSFDNWYHFAIVRNSSVTKLYINGVQVISMSDTANYTGSYMAIGGAYTTSYLTYGYISDVRVVKGTAVYTSAFTPPTTPLTAISGTSLLYSMKNAGIYDNAMMMDFQTVGNAQISTSVKKYGTGSLAFDGSGDYLLSRRTELTNFGTGNFTIEGWFYTGVTSRQDLLGQYSGDYAGNWGVSIGITSSGTIAFYNGNTVIAQSSGGQWSTNTWTHFAVVRSGTSLAIYINGVSVASATNSSDITSTYPNFIVGWGGGAGGPALNGYLDDLRITKGYARYTTTFTPPTSAFPNIGPT